MTPPTRLSNPSLPRMQLNSPSPPQTISSFSTVCSSSTRLLHHGPDQTASPKRRDDLTDRRRQCIRPRPAATDLRYHGHPSLPARSSVLILTSAASLMLITRISCSKIRISPTSTHSHTGATARQPRAKRRRSAHADAEGRSVFCAIPSFSASCQCASVRTDKQSTAGRSALFHRRDTLKRA